MVLQNYVRLTEGVPARLHFVSHILTKRDITDPDTSRPKSVNVLEFQVDLLNLYPVSASFSALAENLADKLSPWLADNRYRTVDFMITKRGTGYRTTYTVEPIMRGHPQPPP